MTQAFLSASTQRQTAARKYLTAEQEWALISQVRERSELLKRKTQGFTLDEKRIHIKGERAFKTLIESYRRVIWSLIYRFHITERFTTDEMYQVAIIAAEKALTCYDPQSFDRESSFGGWIHCRIRFAFLNLMRSEFRFADRNRAFCNVLKQDTQCADERTPLKDAMQEDLRTQLEKVVTESLSTQNALLIDAFYANQKKVKVVAAEFAMTEQAVENRNLRSRAQLRKHPRLQELAQAYFS
jgi:RNA polymerase sigma factor (sigma-70 family)